MHFVYMIYSPSHDVYYKGYTLDYQQRLAQHNNDEGRYTAGKGPWELKFVQAFTTKAEALKRERQLKRQHRKYLEWCIEQPCNLLRAL